MNQVWPQEHFNDEENVATAKKPKKKKKPKLQNKILPTNFSDEVEQCGHRDTLLDSGVNFDVKSRQKKPKMTMRLNDQSTSFNSRLEILKKVCVGKRSRLLGVPYLCFGLILAFVVELFPHTQRYNSVIILILAASSEFRFFPQKSVRPQIVISMMTVFSLVLDVFYLVASRYRLTNMLNAIISFVMMSKCILLFTFLRNVNDSVRTRKYLNRRTRLFFIPLYQPRRIMRDVRGRFLAIGWLSLVGVALYTSVLVALLFHFDYSVSFAAVTASKINLNALSFFLLMKIGSTFIIFLGILYDTDIVLCLWYFGLLGCAVPFVRQYIRSQRIKLQGYPLVFSYAKIRFQILQVLKGIDVLCGAYGWYLLSTYFNSDWYSMDDNLRLLCCAVILILLLTDIHVVSLFLAQRWLLHRHKVLGSIDPQLVASDDSEVEEFRLQVTPADIANETERLLAAERDVVLNALHYKEVTRRDALRAKHRAKHGGLDKTRLKGSSRHAKHNGVSPWNGADDRDLEEGMSAEEEDEDSRDGGSDGSSSSEDKDEELRHLLAISAYDHIAFTAPPDGDQSISLYVLKPRVGSSTKVSPFTGSVSMSDDKLDITRPAAPTKEKRKDRRHKSPHSAVLPVGLPSDVYGSLPESTDDLEDGRVASLRVTATALPPPQPSSASRGGGGRRSRVVVVVSDDRQTGSETFSPLTHKQDDDM